MTSLAASRLRIVHAEFSAAAEEPSSLPAPLSIEVAFVGRSNVGKSSLLNSLCQRHNLFRTSSTPGCTRQLLFFDARTADGAHLALVDVPGYGYAARSKQEKDRWARLIDHYLTQRSTLTAVVLLLDARRGASDDERTLLELLRGPASVARGPLGLVAVATKLDKLPSAQRAAAVRRLGQSLGMEAVGFSTRLPETHLALWRKVRGLLGLAAGPASS